MVSRHEQLSHHEEQDGALCPIIGFVKWNAPLHSSQLHLFLPVLSYFGNCHLNFYFVVATVLLSRPEMLHIKII